MPFEQGSNAQINNYAIEWVGLNAATIQFEYSSIEELRGENVSIRYVGVNRDSLTTLDFASESRLLKGLEVFNCNDVFLHDFTFETDFESPSSALRLHPEVVTAIISSCPAIIDLEQNVYLDVWQDAIWIHTGLKPISHKALGANVFSAHGFDGQLSGILFTKIDVSMICPWIEMAKRKMKKK